MPIYLTVLLLIFGIYFLIRGADWLVDGSSSIARRYGASELVIGLTIVAFGTSAPELFGSVIAALRGSTDLALGNVVGSNIANILLILGVSAIVYPISVKRSTTFKEIPFSMLAAAVLVILVSDGIATGKSVINVYDALILLAFFIIFLYYMFGLFRTSQAEEEDSKERRESKKVPVRMALLMSLGGIVALTLGGEAVVRSAKEVGLQLGVSQAMLGLTVVAIGTSLPELVTSVRAAMKRKADIAVGNVVGSNIFNIFWVLAATAIARPIPISSAIFWDILIVIVSTIFLFVFMFTGKKQKLERWEGAMFIILYVCYLAFTVVREIEGM